MGGQSLWDRIPLGLQRERASDVATIVFAGELLNLEYHAGEQNMNFTKSSAYTAALSALLSSSIAGATEWISTVPVLQPSSKWQVDYADKECRLTGSFGTGKDAIFFRLARGTSFNKFDIILAGLSVPKQTGYVQLRVKFGFDGKVEDFRAESQSVPGRSERLLRWFDGDGAFAKWPEGSVALGNPR